MISHDERLEIPSQVVLHAIDRARPIEQRLQLDEVGKIRLVLAHGSHNEIGDLPADVADRGEHRGDRGGGHRSGTEVSHHATWAPSICSATVRWRRHLRVTRDGVSPTTQYELKKGNF